MKKLILILFVVVVCFSCSNQQKAEKLIKSYMTENVLDRSKYDPIKTTQLDSIKSKLENYKPFKQTRDSFLCYTTLMNMANKHNRVAETDKYIEISEKYSKLLDAVVKKFKPELLGYTAIHKFRGVNTFGNLVINEEEFTFDSEVKMIISVKKVND